MHPRSWAEVAKISRLSSTRDCKAAFCASVRSELVRSTGTSGSAVVALFCEAGAVSKLETCRSSFGNGH